MPPEVECSLPLQETPSGGLFFCGGELTLEGTDEETGAQRVVMQRVRTQLNRDENLSSLISPAPRNNPVRKAGRESLAPISYVGKLRSEKGLHRISERKEARVQTQVS